MIVYIGIAFALLVLAAGIISAANAAKPYADEQAKKAFASELADKCRTPPGYSDEQWKQHMGHHPDLYKECL